jgi:Rieske Fe-S protein
MAQPARSRRSVLGSLILSLLGGAGLWRFLTPRRARSRGVAIAVPVQDVPRHGALVLPHRHTAVVRAADTLLALDLTCPHLGCTVRATEQGFACPCHGSRFGGDGRVLQGPAARALRRRPLEAGGQTVLVSCEDGEES